MSDSFMDRRDFVGCSFAAALAAVMGGRTVAAQVLRPLSVTGGHVTYPVPAADGVFVDRANDVLLARVHGRVYAFSMTCPHQKAAVKWLEKDAIFQCTKHKSKYSPEGAYVSGRATRSLDRFSLQLEEGSVRVDNTKPLRQDRDAAAWAAAVVQV